MPLRSLSIHLRDFLFFRFRPQSIFDNPVTLEDAPDYDELVEHRMDLKTLRNLIECGRVSTSAWHVVQLSR